MSKNKRKKFTNKEVIEFFTELGYNVDSFNGGQMFRIDNKVDVFKSSNNIHFLYTNTWLLTTPKNIVNIIYQELKK